MSSSNTPQPDEPVVSTVSVKAEKTAMATNPVELKIAYDADPVSLDPHEQISGATLQMSHMVFDPIIRWDNNHGFEARLAKNWERIDDVTVRFTLRKGVQFHSGNPLTAADVKWTFDRLLSSGDFKAIFEPFAELKVIDDYQFDLITKRPFPLLLNSATFIFPMDSKFYSGDDENGQPKALLKKHANTFASRNASGTGPFIVTDRQQGVRVDFARNKNLLG